MLNSTASPRTCGPGGGRNALLSLPDRLDFELPDFTRWIWVSEAAQQVWDPRRRAVGAAWSELEWQSVEAGMRDCALTRVSPAAFVALASRCAAAELGVLPLAIEAATDQPYRAKPKPAQEGDPIAFAVVIGRPRAVRRFSAAWQTRDDDAIGAMLGYPACCRASFVETWCRRSLTDTTWSMAVATRGGTPAGERVVALDVAPEANVLLRWLGIRAVPHLPCRFDCDESQALGRGLLELGARLGYAAEMGWLEEMLSWPLEWSALHGIAEIKTPVVKISTRTDATAGRYVVRLSGSRTPAETPSGLAFPYRPAPRTVTRSAGFRRGLAHNAEARQRERDALHHRDNGFESASQMSAAHAAIVDLAQSRLGPRSGRVLDLGCGNGALLRAVCEGNAGLSPVGVEANEDRAARARQLLGPAATIVSGDLFDTDRWTPLGDFELAILMVGRLLEVAGDRGLGLARSLARHCPEVLLYSYAGTAAAGLDDLARRLRLPATGPQAYAGVVETRALMRIARARAVA